MKPPTILLLIRHGETHFVAQGRLPGRLPGVTLTEKGIQQAQTLGKRLADAPIRAVYASPLERARETARPLAEAKGLPILEAAGLNEVDPGEWAGRTLKSLRRLKAWKALRERPEQFTFPGGESFPEAQARIIAQLEDLRQRHPGEMIACFTHADVVRLAVAHYLLMPLHALHRLAVAPASLSVVVFGEDGEVHVPHINHVDGLNLTPPPEKAPRADREMYRNKHEHHHNGAGPSRNSMR
ncbi:MULTISPECIES: histidine phosphatase family protein [Anaerolinea]|uniref:histidine phosphatase family protein n=1 Tax=Anaerolinea TaxID=233189 RepID=UPI002625FE02|nr:histidine phosphatase family protein [Anaerolinea thermophila]